MKKPAAIALAIGATLAGGGVALAQAAVDDPPPVEAPPADPHEDTPVGPPESVPPVEDETSDTTEAVDTTDAPEDDAGEVGTAEGTHGADVSVAAHECPTGEGGVHGECVSAVARDHDGDGTPDHGPGSPDAQGASSRGGGRGAG